MVGSPFIYTQCGKRRTLLNTTQIGAITVEEVDVTSKEGALFYSEYDPSEGKIFVLQILMADGRPFRYLFASAADRDAMYDQIMAALAPALTIIDTSPDVQRKPKGPKTVYNGYTAEEIDHAMTMLAVTRAREQQPAPAPPVPPAAKPPRKPRTPQQ